MRPAAPGPVGSDERQATGREKHDQKITVYLSAAELLDLEHARLALRRFGLVIDRGRLVREGIAILLADLDARGKDSVVARRIRASRNGNGTHGELPPGELSAGEQSPDNDGSTSSDALTADAADAADPAADAAGAASPLPSLTWRKLRAAP